MLIAHCSLLIAHCSSLCTSGILRSVRRFGYRHDRKSRSCRAEASTARRASARPDGHSGGTSPRDGTWSEVALKLHGRGRHSCQRAAVRPQARGCQSWDRSLSGPVGPLTGLCLAVVIGTNQCGRPDGVQLQASFLANGRRSCGWAKARQPRRRSACIELSARCPPRSPPRAGSGMDRLTTVRNRSGAKPRGRDMTAALA